MAGEAYQLSVIRDVTEQRRLQLHKAEIDRALHRLTQWSQRITGESFFQMLVDDLASALQTEHAMIGLLEGDAPGQVYTLAVHDRGAAADNYRYSFADAPCEDILTGEICLYASGIQQSFPRDHVLVTQGWDSYAGAPIRDAAGNTIGLLAVMDSRPLGNPELVKSLLQVYGERASAELEREHAEEALLESERSFSTIFQASPVAMCVIPFGGDYPVKDVNDAFERLFLRPREVVVGKKTMSQLALFLNRMRNQRHRPACSMAPVSKTIANTGCVAATAHQCWWKFQGIRSMSSATNSPFLPAKTSRINGASKTRYANSMPTLNTG
ncbi:GAF domain-containing protein [Undibacterium arcticum]